MWHIYPFTGALDPDCLRYFFLSLAIDDTQCIQTLAGENASFNSMSEAQSLAQFVLRLFQLCEGKVLIEGLTAAEFIRHTTGSPSFQSAFEISFTSPKLSSHNCQRQASQSKSRELERKKRSTHHIEWSFDTRAGAKVGKGNIVSFWLLIIARRVDCWDESAPNNAGGGSTERFPGNNMTWSVREKSRARLRYALGDSLDLGLMYKICKESNCAISAGRSAFSPDSFFRSFWCGSDECVTVVVTRSEIGPAERLTNNKDNKWVQTKVASTHPSIGKPTQKSHLNHFLGTTGRQWFHTKVHFHAKQMAQSP